MTHDYDDIINLPHYEPKHHPRMSMWNRAAQFAPFAALTGYDAAIQESNRVTDDWMDLGESGNEELNRKMVKVAVFYGFRKFGFCGFLLFSLRKC